MATPVDILEDLDSFLARVSDEEKENDEEELERPELGYACKDCRNALSPVMAATLNTHRGCLKEILEAQGRSVSLSVYRSESGATVAHHAARRGDLETLQLLLGADQSLCKAGDVRGATPLHVCAYHGQLECLSCLLEKDAWADQKDFDGATAVHFAAASGHLDCLKELVLRGKGNPNEQTQSGETPGMSVRLLCRF